MPPRKRTSRAAPKAVAVEEVVPTENKAADLVEPSFSKEDNHPFLDAPCRVPTEQTAEQDAAPKAVSFVPAAPSCAMTEKKWQGKYPVWQCRICRVDTLDPGLAKAARRACRK